MQSRLVVLERAARKLCPLDGILAFLNPALPHNLLLERRVEGGVFKALPSRNGRGSKRIYAISASKNSRFVPSGF